jgi:oxygen-dependent protoporphyrinogen oxidase
MLEEMSAELARRLEQVRYVSTAAVFLGYREGPEIRIPPSSGFLIAVAERRGIFGATFASNKFEERAPEGRLLVRAFVGGALDEPAAEQPDEAMIASTREALAGTIGLCAEPEFSRVQRWPKANPQYEIGHGRIVAAVDAALAGLPGLFVTGSALRGVGVPDGVKLGREAAARVREFLVAA